MPVLGSVVAVRLQLSFVGLGAEESAHFLGPWLLGWRCQLMPP